ncbi:hypothetical protein [Pseudomonas typographi]|uniref:Lipoprotein n=1 Tax=Pseudomonas typographi TaxID=2715964 RepID=A0ABR7Z6Z7_9PSED|nr:hypothetical protein [Pseudomonas typographi]MBD1553834.1 hypothetical protein [Pseudomonas typographi]MBD1588528.1 hypothetical protein [Pseudomonas typographi]MBD1601230.1 hypothetical protein [Pseudomonas typographi]
MRYARSWLLAAMLPLFAGCQALDFSGPQGPQALSGQTRMQGSLTAEGGHLIFTPCDSPRTFIVTDNGDTGILQEATTLASLNRPLYADLRGRFDGNPVEGQPGQLNLQTLYRVESALKACEDQNYKLMQFYADGHGPSWVARVNAQGLLIEREGQPPLAVPFVEEQAPGGGVSLSSDANHQHIQLWLAPQRCESGPRVSFFAAELRIDEQVLRGCGYPGGAREQ